MRRLFIREDMVLTTAAPRPVAWSRADTVMLIGITLIAGFMRVLRLGTPAQYIWDEFYAQDACFYLQMPVSVCDTDQELTWMHPPLGKWLIAAGIEIFGHTPFGWRFAAAVMGTVGVGLLYVLARKIFRSTFAATVAAGLLAIDWLHFAQSRIAMLDVFLCTFFIAAVLFVVYDRDRLLPQNVERAGSMTYSRLNRPWRYLCGVMAGAALAMKWSGASVLLVVLGLTICWEVAARRARGMEHPVRRAVRCEWPSVALGLVALPLSIYMLSYLGDVHRSFAGDIQGTVFAWPWSESSWFREFLRRQVQMLVFHRTLVGVHLYASEGWSWPLLKRPALFFLDVTGGQYREILAAGNPLVWWPALLALVYIGMRWARRRSFAGPEGIILASFAVSYLPWLYLSRVRVLGFIFYFLLSVPSLCLALAYVGLEARRNDRWRRAMPVGLVLAILMFLFFYPILSAWPVSRSFWDLHILFRDCQGVVEPGFHGGPPPPGWCWI